MLISIDLWGTLIKSSPSFVDAKLNLFKKYFDAKDEFILECFKQTKKELNNIIESTGIQPQDKFIFQLLFTKINGSYKFSNNIYEIIRDYQELVIENPPLIYSDETIEYLQKLSEIGTLILSSNTLFIKGSTLALTLNKKYNIFSHFSKIKFSDSVGYSKPDAAMYGGSNIHIGDNNITDGIGATLAGSKPIIINSNQLTIKDAYNIITQI